MDELIAYKVDIQNDFMNEKNGRLYVPDAEKIKPAIVQVEATIRAKGIREIFGMDRHFEDDPELIRNGGPFPDHCMDWKYGQVNADGKHGIDLIPEVQPDYPVYIENKIMTGNHFRKYTRPELETLAGIGKPVIIEKQHYDVFTNPATETLFKVLGVKKAIVYGVATNICDLAFVLGAQKRNIQCYVVEDAIQGIDITPGATDAAITEMKNAGAIFVKAKDVLEGKLW